MPQYSDRRPSWDFHPSHSDLLLGRRRGIARGMWSSQFTYSSSLSEFKDAFSFTSIVPYGQLYAGMCYRVVWYKRLRAKCYPQDWGSAFLWNVNKLVFYCERHISEGRQLHTQRSQNIWCQRDSQYRATKMYQGREHSPFFVIRTCSFGYRSQDRLRQLKFFVEFLCLACVPSNRSPVFGFISRLFYFIATFSYDGM
jgi:hypothetical protein